MADAATSKTIPESSAGPSTGTAVAAVPAPAGPLLPEMRARVQQILARAAQADAPRFASPERVFLTADGVVVEDGDDFAAYLLVGVGGQIPLGLARELGLDGDASGASVTPGAGTTTSAGG